MYQYRLVEIPPCIGWRVIQERTSNPRNTVRRRMDVMSRNEASLLRAAPHGSRKSSTGRSHSAWKQEKRKIAGIIIVKTNRSGHIERTTSATETRARLYSRNTTLRPSCEAATSGFV